MIWNDKILLLLKRHFFFLADNLHCITPCEKHMILFFCHGKWQVNLLFFFFFLYWIWLRNKVIVLLWYYIYKGIIYNADDNWLNDKNFYIYISIYVYTHTICSTINEVQKWGICYIFVSEKQIFFCLEITKINFI